MASITKIRSAVVRANFNWTYARVYTDGGVHGTGECFFAPGLPQIIDEFESILIGEDPLNIEKLVEKMRWAASGTGSLGGIIWNAITGIEAALWDLKGKLTNLPVYQLLGGKFRDRVRIYLDCHAAGALDCLSTLLQRTPPSWDYEPARDLPPDEIPAASARRARQMVELGYTALKFDLDLPGTDFSSATGYTLKSRDIEWMARLASEIRAAVGPDVDLAMDAHWRYRPSEILQVAKALEPIKLMWLEDPCPPHDLKSLTYLRPHTSTPIATGENLQLREGFRAIIFDDLVDVVTPDLQKAGGLAEGRKIADMAHTANKPFAPHMIGSPLALMASAQLSLTIPNFTVCEFHAHDVPFFGELCATPIDEWFQHGWVTPPGRAGLGIDLNETVGKKHRLPGSRWFDER